MRRAELCRVGCLCAAGFALLIAGCHHSDFPTFPANYREFAYVSNGSTNTVTVLDVVHLRADRTLAVGRDPSGLAANPRRNEVYAVNSGSNTVTVIDAATNTVAATIAAGAKPYSISVSSDGNWGYVADAAGNSVSLLDLRRRKLLQTAGAGERPGKAQVSPDGSSVVVANYAGGSVSIFDTGLAPYAKEGEPRLRLRAVVSGCPGATDLAILPDSSKVFVACSGGHQVMAAALARAARGQNSANRDALLAMLDVGRSPVALTMKPDGGEIFVSNFDGDSISEIATGANEVGGTYFIGAHPSHGVVSADGALLYVSNFAADNVTVYSIDDGRIVPPSLPAGHQPDALALSAEGHLLFVANSGSGDVTVLRTRTQSMLTILPAGGHPNDIVVKAFTAK